MAMRAESQSYFYISIVIIIFLILSLLPSTNGSICSGNNASPNWYGDEAYPPYFTRDSEPCPQKYSLSRCEQSAVMKDGSSNFTIDESGAKVCTMNVDCFGTKQNCNDTLVCSDLIKLKNELMTGGHNIVCRHEKTYWQQFTGEVQNCHINKNCLDPAVKATQRQMQPMGWKSAHNFATSFRDMGIPIGKTYSSPFTRCAEHAQLFSDNPNEELLELLYMATWEEVLELNNITVKSALNALKWQSYGIRNLVGKKPPTGQNTFVVTHGFNIKLAFGTAVDEGYCMIFKPQDNLPSLAKSIGSLTVGNKVFNFDNDSYPVDAIARMSPESALLMQTCGDVRSDAMNNRDDLFSMIDTDHDMKITREEFTTAHGNLNNTEDAFDFVSSVVGNSEFLGKPKDLESLELGQFFHINWGWREYKKTGGNIQYPWRHILENTIGPLDNKSPENRVAAFKRANSILSKLIILLRDQTKYPTKEIMEERFINCNVNKYVREVTECAAKVFMDQSGGEAYIPIGPGDFGAATSNDESIFDIPLAYPSQWKPGIGFYDSRLLKVATCLVSEHILSLSETLALMGCTKSATDDRTTLPTLAPTAPPNKCALENQRSGRCTTKHIKDECCPGLVCHEFQAFKCVKEEYKSCAGLNNRSRECGSNWKRATPTCCPNLVCNFETNRCVSPTSQD